MKLFTRICGALFPNIIPIYITAEGVRRQRTCFRTMDLTDIRISAARAYGVAASPFDTDSALDQALRAAGRQMFILLDEADELYRIDKGEEPIRSKVLQTLGDLQALGNGISGLYCVMLCGSSASMYRLVCSEPRHLSAKYPLVVGAPGLNR